MNTEKIFALILITTSLLAIGNAFVTYKYSTYFESTTRVDLDQVIANVDQLEKSQLVNLTRRLTTISNSDFTVLNNLSDQFRKVIIFLIINLLLGLAFIIFLLLKLPQKTDT